MKNRGERGLVTQSNDDKMDTIPDAKGNDDHRRDGELVRDGLLGLDMEHDEGDKYPGNY